MKTSDIRAISQAMPQPSITKIRLKITYLKFQSNFPGANELIIVIKFMWFIYYIHQGLFIGSGVITKYG